MGTAAIPPRTHKSAFMAFSMCVVVCAYKEVSYAYLLRVINVSMRTLRYPNYIGSNLTPPDYAVP